MQFRAEDRVTPPPAADEARTLLGFLNYQRDTLRWKCAGLTATQLATPLAPTEMTLGGLLKHLAVVEDGWFRRALLGEPPAAWYRDFVDDPDWDFRTAAGDDPGELVARYQQACERSREAVASMASLDDLTAEVPGPDASHRFNVRWVLLHMIEETARHAGHADLIREAIDGAKGE
jgi:uncharacterized damage-inducible protein DinB